MKRAFLCLIMVLSLGLTGCNSLVPKNTESFGDSISDTSSDIEVEIVENNPVSLDILVVDYGNTEDYWLGTGGIKQSVEADNPEISLNITILPWDDAERELETRLFNGNPFDIAITENAEDLAKRGVLESPLKYGDASLLSKISFGQNIDKGIPVGFDPYVLFIKKEVSEITGIVDVSVKNVGWDAIIHGKEDHTEGMIPFFIDVTTEGYELSKEALFLSTGEKDDEKIAGSLLSEVSNNPDIRRKTAYEGVVGVCKGEIAMAIAPKGILTVLTDVDTSDLITIDLPGTTKVLYDSMVVFKKAGEDEDNRLRACGRVFDAYFGDGYKAYIEKEGFEPSY